MGIWLRVEKGDYVSFADYEFATASNLAIAAGAVIVVVTFLGVVGSIKGNRLMLLLVKIISIYILVVRTKISAEEGVEIAAIIAHMHAQV